MMGLHPRRLDNRVVVYFSLALLFPPVTLAPLESAIIRNALKYELTAHAATALKERGIQGTWLEQVLNNPAKTETDETDPALVHHLGKISEHGGRILRVVFNNRVSPVRVVTVYFDRRLKGKI
jgi:hypothetical protein